MTYASKIVHKWKGHLEIFSCPQIIENYRQCLLLQTVVLQKPVVGCSSFASIRYLRYWFYLPMIIHYHNVSLVTVVSVFSGKV